MIGLRSTVHRHVTYLTFLALPCRAVKLSLVGGVGARRMDKDAISDEVDMRLLASPDGRGLTAWM
jgi:hypothetical protein